MVKVVYFRLEFYVACNLVAYGGRKHDEEHDSNFPDIQ